jgi:membrane protease YdiL (CAAX protease family)
LWTAIVAMLVFSGPNLITVALGGLDTGETVELSGGVLIFSLLFTLILQVIIFGIALLPLLVTKRLDRRLWGPQRTSWSVVWIGLAVGVVTAIVAYTLNGIAAFLVGAEDPVEQQLLQDALTGGATLAIVALLAVVVAPLVEEVLFRGVLFRSLMDRTGVWVAAVLSSALFAIVHVEVVVSQPVALVGLFTVGLVLAIAYRIVGNLWIPIIGHAVFNGISLSLAIVVDRLGLDELVALADAARLLSPAARLIG